MLDDTTRRYLRTTGEAFKGPDYAQAIESPARGYGAAWWICFTLATVVAAVVMAVTA